MTSEKDPGIPGARGTRVGIIFESIFKNRRKIFQKFVLGGFPGSQSRIWHWRRSQVYLILGELVSASSSGVFLKIEDKSSENLVLGVFEVVNHEYTIEEGPRYTWCPGNSCPHHLWKYFKNRREIFCKFGLGGFRGSQSRIWHRKRTKVYLVPRKLVSAPPSRIFLKIEEKSFESSVSADFEVVNHEYDIDEGPRYT